MYLHEIDKTLSVKANSCQLNGYRLSTPATPKLNIALLRHNILILSYDSEFAFLHTIWAIQYPFHFFQSPYSRRKYNLSQLITQ